MKTKNFVIIVLSIIVIVFIFTQFKVARSSKIERDVPSKIELDVSSRLSCSPDGKYLLLDATTGGKSSSFFGIPYFHSGPRDIYLLDLDDAHIERLTDTGNNSAPIFSPDGTKIAFISNREGENKIYLMDSNGKNLKRLTENTSLYEFPPSFSPDGTKLVFARVTGKRKHILTFELNSGEEREIKIISDSAYGTYYENPWFFDNNTILHAIGVDGYIEYLSQPQVPKKEIYWGGNYPFFSPDRTRAALARNGEIFITDSSGRNATSFHLGFYYRIGTFSADGKNLFLMSGNPEWGVGLELWRVDINGSNLERISF